jgi:hypothetical protein
VLPAVDVGKSVSRVGGKAQRAAYRAVAGDLKLAYAQFEELETSPASAPAWMTTPAGIEHGRRIRACLKQPEFAPGVGAGADRRACWRWTGWRMPSAPCTTHRPAFRRGAGFETAGAAPM